MGVEPATLSAYQDAVCALRLAVWTLERASATNGIDPLPVVNLIVRRAEELRQTLERARAAV